MNISLMEAYIIEALKSRNYSFEQVEHYLEIRDVSVFQQHAKFDFSLLQNLYDSNRDGLKEAYEVGYKVKFLTINGLKNLLQARLAIQPSDYKEHEKGITGLKVNEPTEQAIRAFVSDNWQITRLGDTISIEV